jgi:hypothetical protein
VNVTDPPNVIGFELLVRLVVVLALTACWTALEVLPASPASPP